MAQSCRAKRARHSQEFKVPFKESLILVATRKWSRIRKKKKKKNGELKLLFCRVVISEIDEKEKRKKKGSPALFSFFLLGLLLLVGRGSTTPQPRRRRRRRKLENVLGGGGGVEELVISTWRKTVDWIFGKEKNSRDYSHVLGQPISVVGTQWPYGVGLKVIIISVLSVFIGNIG